MATGKSITKVFGILMVAMVSLIALFFAFIVVILCVESYNNSRYDDTQLGMSLNEVKEKWGRPDGICSQHNDLQGIYFNKGFLTTSYEFRFNKDSILIEKEMDN